MIIKCKECGKDISSFAMRCPYCGAPTTGAKVLALIEGICAFGAIITIGLMINSL